MNETRWLSPVAVGKNVPQAIQGAGGAVLSYAVTM